MVLHIGGEPRIDDPTWEQIAHAFRHLPADAAFLILEGDVESYVQAADNGDHWRVEWRQESRQWHIECPLDQAEAVFRAFLAWDEPAIRAFPWKRPKWWNDPLLGAFGLMLFVLAISLAKLWSALR